MNLHFQSEKNVISPKASKWMIIKMTTALLLFFSFQSNANDHDGIKTPPIEINGRVVDKAGDPLQGVSVFVTGTQKGTTTNKEGRFTISIPDGLDNVLLEISNVGFKSTTVTVGNQTELNITLEEDAAGLDQVVVVGYGTVKKRDLTGSISSVSTERINAFPAPNVMQALTGRAAGVQVKQNNGAPGAPISVRIRGTNSIVGNNEPLYVVDGFPVSTADNINNSSIESIEVLKDASAVAIYGSRAANGVVLITTKRGKSGVSRVSFQSSFGGQRLIKKMEMMNPEEYGLYYNQLYANMGLAPLFTDAEMSNFASLGKGTDWQDVVFHDAPIQNHSLNISGGSEKTQFSITGSVFDQEGIIRNSNYKRYSLNSSLQHKISDALSIDVNLTMSKNTTLRKLSGEGRFGTSLIGRAFGIPAALPVYEDDGSYMEPVNHYSWVSEALYSPLNYINEQSDKVSQNRVLANAAISYKIAKGLVLRVSGGIESNDSKSDFYQTKRFQNNINGIANVSTTDFTSLLNENTLSYTNTFNKKHRLSAVAGFTYQDFLTTSLSGGGSGFLSDVTESYDLATASTPTTPGTSYSRSVLLSGLGRVNYTFNDRYLFTVSFRADGSSIYTAGNKWGYFPSAAFAWRLSD
ncbi:MAG TPA: SusC/RagA family TonB-linked outer membrane protein, partial [Flavitalea sp.]|nr:SusC/RagA family TonB-linked outer membrane protein [Flavitalea sp.]